MQKSAIVCLALIAVLGVVQSAQNAPFTTCDFVSPQQTTRVICNQIEAIAKMMAKDNEKQSAFITPFSVQNWILKQTNSKLGGYMQWTDLLDLGYRFVDETNELIKLTRALKQKKRVLCVMMDSAVWGVCEEKALNSYFFTDPRSSQETQIQLGQVQRAAILSKYTMEGQEPKKDVPVEVLKHAADRKMTTCNFDNLGATGTSGHFLTGNASFTGITATSKAGGVYAGKKVRTYSFWSIGKFQVTAQKNDAFISIWNAGYTTRLADVAYKNINTGSQIVYTPTNLTANVTYTIEIGLGASGNPDNGFYFSFLSTQDGCFECVNDEDCGDTVSYFCASNICQNYPGALSCTGANFFDPYTDSCIRCYTDSDCTYWGRCLNGQCMSSFCNEECSGATPYCDTYTHECEQCRQDWDCPSNDCINGRCCPICPLPEKPYCTGWDLECVECIDNYECPEGWGCNSGVCYPCNGGCYGYGYGYSGVCDPLDNECYECVTDFDCEEDAEFPQCINHKCEPCTPPDNTPCRTFGSQHVCNIQGACVECTQDSHCPLSTASKCNLIYQMCDPCDNGNHTQCAHNWHRPYCVYGDCVECVSNVECPSGTTCSNNHCN